MFRIVCLVLSCSVLCAANVNLAELEHISDELPERDCFRLLLALNDSRWGMTNLTQIDQLWHDQQEDFTCIKRLQKWHHKGHRTESSEFFALRLSQLGYPELSAWLSRQISKEEEDMVDQEFFHFRRFVGMKGKGKGAKKNHRLHYRTKLHGNKVEQKLSADPWSKWRWLAVVVALLVLFQVFCCCFLSIIPKEQTQRFRHHFYVHLCGWKRDPPPGDFHYLCI